MLKMGHSPWLLPPLITTLDGSVDQQVNMVNVEVVRQLVDSIESYMAKAKDALLYAKIQQAHEANKDHGPDPEFKVGESVFGYSTLMLGLHASQDGKVAKFMLHFDGPFEITKVYPESSLYHLHLPASSKIFPVFHVSQLR